MNLIVIIKREKSIILLCQGRKPFYNCENSLFQSQKSDPLILMVFTSYKSLSSELQNCQTDLSNSN